jgi:hypothetical protein
MVAIISWEWSSHNSHSRTSVPLVLEYQFTATWTVDSRMVSFILDELNYPHGGESFGFVHQGPDL